MKFVLATKGPGNRTEAWACVMANLALPGSGSLAAGKPIGYYQLGVTAFGFIVSVVTGIHLLQWMLGNWARINDSTGDPVANLVVIWQEIKWPLAGLAIFAMALLWAGITSLQILAAHPKNPVPPRIVQ